MDESQRTHHRVPVHAEVTLVSENNFYAGITDNISEGGVFVATHQPPAVGQEVEVALSLPEMDRVFMVRGVVRWLRSVDASCDGMPPGCGLQWIGLPKEALIAIKHFVQERETLLYEAA